MASYETYLTAIKARWDSATGATTRALATGGLWLTKVPQGTTPPYVRLDIISGTEFDTMSTKLDSAFITFGIFANEDQYETMVQIRDLLVTLYDDVLLTMASQNMVRAVRLTPGLILEEPQKGYSCHIDYWHEFG